MADENPSVTPQPTQEPIPNSSAPREPEASRSLRGPSARSKKRRNTLIIVVVLVAAVAGLLLWRYLSSYESTDDAQVDVHLYPVSARVSGYVIKVNVGDNQYVHQGDVLVEIDPKDYQVAVDQAKANLASAEATAESLNINVPITTVNTSSTLKFTASDVENAHAGISAAQAQLKAAHAQLEQALANDVKAQDDLVRYKALVEKKEVSDQTYDQALAASKASTASVAAGRANEAAAEDSVKQAQSKLVQAEANQRAAETAPQQVSSTQARARAALADVAQKRAVLDQALLNLGYTKIVAPFDG